MLRFFLKPQKNVFKPYSEGKRKLKEDSVFKDGTYLRFMFCVFMVAFCFLMVFSMVPVYYKEQVHMSESLIGIVLAMNGLIIAITEMIIVYKLEGKRSETFYISIGAFLIGISFLSLNLSATVNIVLLSMLIITLGEMLMFPFVNTYWVTRSKNHNRAQYASIFTISFSLAHVLAPTIGSQIVKHYGYNSLWYTLAGVCTLASVFFYSFRKLNVSS